MAHLIDKDALLAEIEIRIRELELFVDAIKSGMRLQQMKDNQDESDMALIAALDGWGLNVERKR